ncbi:sensor histidine kinase [Alkalihalobacillus sp. CinArs1]|uniref:sensor histidine kinase n=1 Tax=Alkalihalobacillus sp. CinArs1 TaxID=2995314 RepID=UPI0022DE1BDC|nr:ATP-binding protein [Alkalihalobacillus sp. CinArs1]
MKSLYVQIVATFLIAIFFSLFVTFLISGRLYEHQISDRVEQRMQSVGRDFIEIYQSNPDLDISTYLDAISSISFDIVLFSEKLDTAVYESRPIRNLSQEAISEVLNGEPYKTQEQLRRTIVGIPFVVEGQSYAIFITPNFQFIFNDFRKVMLTLFSSILLLGSAIFIITTKYTIRPIKEMTTLTKKVARGNFNVSIESKRKDELGELTHHFNHMVKGLNELEDMRQQFVSNVSHEIQSPLTSIQGFARALKDDVVKDEKEGKEYLSIIEHESMRLSSLSQNLLKLATLDSEHPPFESSAYYLDEQLRRVVASLEPQWSEKHQTIQLDTVDYKIQADEDQLKQVWINLITNAIRYTPEEKKITVAMQEREDAIVVSISDEGVGISPEEQVRVFERFYKVDKSRTRNQGGNGLGLSIARKIIHLHQGSVEIESDIGIGTTFLVTLPQIKKTHKS